ncbi:MAG: aminoglycoside phosphotransferase family protein, partial [Spirochaetales bacterium]|nr:aminoglycoside phosphotransferase family protein [Spirochaetales bacterium]
GDGSVWRLYIFIRDTIAFDIVDSPSVAREGGLAFGEFQNLLSDLPGDPLFETIPDFHDMEKRLYTFQTTVDLDTDSRGGVAAAEIDFISRRAEEMTIFQRFGREGKLEKRITHNDTKINNVLMDSDDCSAVCVIDLDTVMPGYILFDFGDSIRTATNTGAEDDLDLTKVGCDLELFEGYTNGYLASAGAFLSEVELSLLTVSARVMTFIIGLRFLTDFIDGDKYFKVHRPGHNLDRARAQFKLLSSMEEKADEMEKIVKLARERQNG